MLIHLSTFRVEYHSLVGRQDFWHRVCFCVGDHSGSYEKINMEQAQTLTLLTLFVQSNCLLTICQGAVGLVVVSPLELLY